MRRIASFILCVVLLLAGTRTVFAEGFTVTLQLFWAIGCPHCEKEQVFLKTVASTYPNIRIEEYEITKNPDNLQLLRATQQRLQISVSGVPLTVVGDKYVVGYQDDETTGKEIIHLIEGAKRAPQTIAVPFAGSLEIQKFSLPLLTVILGLLDGFNPCAMWTLLFLISLLLGMKDRARMWILGSTFIVSSALVYFLFLSAWLHAFLFLGFVVWVRIAIGIVAFASGIYYIRDYMVNKSGACTVTKGEKKKKIFEALKTLAHKKEFIFAFVGIMLLAFAVNLVELVCSAGLPAIFTQVLTLSHLPMWQYYAYLLLYIVFFMLDDMAVFIIAMITMRAVGMNGGIFSRYSHLAGGVLMVVIGLLLLIAPELLMFG